MAERPRYARPPKGQHLSGRLGLQNRILVQLRAVHAGIVDGPHPGECRERKIGVARNDFHFITRWAIEGTLEEVSDILGDPLGLKRWWPSVYLEVWEIAPGDELCVGRRIGLHTKGWLPYTLHWQFVVTEVRYPYGFSLEASGDFVGRGIWTFEPEGPRVSLTYDWLIRADKPLLKYGSFLMRPIFAANHRWAMARGEESLRLELARHHALSQEERERVPAPPGPTWPSKHHHS
jgi:hypothetical protein